MPFSLTDGLVAGPPIEWRGPQSLVLTYAPPPYDSIYGNGYNLTAIVDIVRAQVDRLNVTHLHVQLHPEINVMASCTNEAKLLMSELLDVLLLFPKLLTLRLSNSLLIVDQVFPSYAPYIYSLRFDFPAPGIHRRPLSLEELFAPLNMYKSVGNLRLTNIGSVDDNEELEKDCRVLCGCVGVLSLLDANDGALDPLLNVLEWSRDLAAERLGLEVMRIIELGRVSPTDLPALGRFTDAFGKGIKSLTLNLEFDENNLCE